MRIVFMGTPDFAVTSLQALAESGRHEIAGVVTQPDRPKGRGQRLLMPPVKEYALGRGYAVYQPQKIKTEEFVAQLRQLAPDLIVVAAFGQLLSREILQLPRYGCLNVHASLLPAYRGAAPIHYAILRGERATGVTIMQMDAGMDTGDMLAQAVVSISDNMTMGELHDVLKARGAELLLAVMEQLEAGTAVPVRQNEAEATYAPLLRRSMEKIDWQKPAREVHNLIRAFNPAPGAFTVLPDGRLLKLWSSRLTVQSSAARPGTVTEVGRQGFCVACGDGVLEITEVQPESKKRMAAAVFCNGRSLGPGCNLGGERNDGSGI